MGIHVCIEGFYVIMFDVLYSRLCHFHFFYSSKEMLQMNDRNGVIRWDYPPDILIRCAINVEGYSTAYRIWVTEFIVIKTLYQQLTYKICNRKKKY